MTNIKAEIFDKQPEIPGKPRIIVSVNPPITNRPKWDKIQQALKNGQSLSTVDCN